MSDFVENRLNALRALEPLVNQDPWASGVVKERPAHRITTQPGEPQQPAAAVNRNVVILGHRASLSPALWPACQPIPNRRPMRFRAARRPLQPQGRPTSRLTRSSVMPTPASADATRSPKPGLQRCRTSRTQAIENPQSPQRQTPSRGSSDVTISRNLRPSRRQQCMRQVSSSMR